MMAGLNNRVGALALADVRGALGFGLDDASWLTTVYSAGEVLSMPFSAWFAITLSVRRFELWMIRVCTLLAVCIPFIHDLDLLLAMRSEEHTSELPSLIRISYDIFCLKQQDKEDTPVTNRQN